MIKNILIIGFILFQFTGQSQGITGNISNSSTDQRQTSNFRWMNALNNDMSSLESCYTSNPIKVFLDATVVESINGIKDHYKSNSIKIDSIWTTFKIKANNIYNYEIGGFKSGKEIFMHLIITDSSKDDKRTFEFIARSSHVQPHDEELNTRRKKWVELCNMHNAGNLVRELYHNPSVYYSHRPPTTDREALISEYGYMNNPGYSLKLSPIHIETVTENLAFEIGQCEGSYNGKYILIWRKDPVTGWKILVDSNI
ncbi:MAG: hypothetical protein HKN00_08850 [Flavobacteriaceae bacterium]|nr:hypothetical protein [Bacteroidia bacterium]NNF75277.1 hypothetical protein [Flavobacteriaceae bacterium]NNK86752.1 hypothetical protein [Flavobacteriaceae bacterium]